MKFCQNCGASLNDDAKFCDKCGHRVVSSNNGEQQNQEKVHKCPYCDKVLPFYVDRCPACGNEIRGREVTNSVKELIKELDATSDDIKKIDIIKTFPIPSNKEDVVEFMLLASSNFDVQHYLSFREKDTVDSAWLTKIEQCYKKAEMMFTRREDLALIKRIYDDVHTKLNSTSKSKRTNKIAGILTIIVSSIGIVAISLMPRESDGAVTTFAMILFVLALAALTIGILLVVFSNKKKMTAKEYEEEKERKLEKDRAKAALKIEKERNKKRR